MKEFQYLLLGLCIIGFFGSISMFTPNTPWNDITYLFRKVDKQKYLRYSNKFFGKTWLTVGISSLILFLLTLIIKINIPIQLILFLFFIYLFIRVVLLEVGWRKVANK
ncbi:hypothetical protein IGI46_005085 [Enterococcus sp. AZ163]